jgi:hypothetical protein
MMSKNKYPWVHPEPITDAGESLRATMATDPRDWCLYRRDAWVYGIVMGWNKESLTQLQKTHHWTDEAITRLVNLHQQFDERFPQWWEHDVFDENVWAANVLLRSLYGQQGEPDD